MLSTDTTFELPTSCMSTAQAEEAFSCLFGGAISETEMKDFLLNLAKRGETEEEILGCARAMIKRAGFIECGTERVFDIGGTGGDGLGTFNISTTSALVTAACGLSVLKHGNRGVTGRSGSADLIEALGVNLASVKDHNKLRACLAEVGLAYIFTPLHHRFPENLNVLRKQLGVRTIFNLAGPVAHPAALTGQVLGVANPNHRHLICKVLARLKRPQAWVVHGADGSDEISITGRTHISALDNGKIRQFTLTPNDFGLKTSSIEDIRGGNAEDNANFCRKILNGEPGARTDAVLATSASTLVMANVCRTLPEAVKMARGAIQSGQAKKILTKLQEFTHDHSS